MGKKEGILPGVVGPLLEMSIQMPAFSFEANGLHQWEEKNVKRGKTLGAIHHYLEGRGGLGRGKFEGYLLKRGDSAEPDYAVLPAGGGMEARSRSSVCLKEGNSSGGRGSDLTSDPVVLGRGRGGA